MLALEHAGPSASSLLQDGPCMCNRRGQPDGKKKISELFFGAVSCAWRCLCATGVCAKYFCKPIRVEKNAIHKKANIASSGAGRNLSEAAAPAVIALPGKGRVVIFSFGLESSGIPLSWAAAADRPGVNLLADLSDNSVHRIAQSVRKIKQTKTISSPCAGIDPKPQSKTKSYLKNSS